MASTIKLRGLFGAFPRGNPLGRALVVTTTLLVAFGTVMVASSSEGLGASGGGSMWYIMSRDLAYLVIGFFLFLLMAKVRIDRLLSMSRMFILLGLVMLFVVWVKGVSANGGRRWLNLGVILLQPSELFKLATVLFVAAVVQAHHDQIGHWKVLAVRFSPVLAGLGLVIIEPDIGTTSVIAMIAVVMLAMAGLSGQMLARVGLLGLVAVGGYASVKLYALTRLLSFLSPNSNLANGGYQLWQSKIGLGAGGLYGLGLGHSREKWGYLPNPHTDFIFSIVGEELGLVGTLSVIALFVVFLYFATRIAQACTNDVYRLLVVGITTWIIFEALVNIASVVGFWAVTGIPLPFFSYGGTALLTELAAVGLLYNIANDSSRSRDVTIQAYPMATLREMVASRPVPTPVRHRVPSRPQGR